MKLNIFKNLKQSKLRETFSGTMIGKYVKTIILLMLGLFLGWLIFGGSNDGSEIKENGHNHQAENKKGQVWTCSMHTQIREDGPGQCPICGMDLIPVGEGNENDNLSMLEMTPSAVSLANVMTEIVKADKPEKTIYLNGRIEIDERNLHRQIAHFSGRIEELYINFTGQYVRKGEKIARIYSPELVSAQKELFEAINLKSSMPNIYQAAKEKLRLWKLTDKQITAIEKSGKVREEIDILADFSGYVIKRLVATGSRINLGDILFDIANLSKVWIVFDVYEEDIRWVKRGDMINFTASSIPGKQFKAEVKYVEPVLNAADRTVKIWTEYSNVGNLLKPEMLVRGVLKSKKPFKTNKIIIPKSAVLWTGKRSIVYVKVPDKEVPTFEMREITLGDNLGDSYIVEDGLKEDEELVVNGVFQIDAAAQLSGKYSSMNQPKKKETDVGIPDFKSQTSAEFKRQLTSLLESYIALTDNLVQSNDKKATESAKQILTKLKDVDMSLLRHEGHKFWMKKMKIIKEAAKSMSKSQNIDKQRKEFIALSEAMISSAKAFGTQKVFYLVHCPMADDGKGANWLSVKNEVLNPYFGDVMLNCGEVVEKIK